MRKPDSLKALLLDTVPGLKENPDTLALFIERGSVKGGGGRTLSFRYTYSLNLVFEGYAGDLDGIAVPILAWLTLNQPDLLNRPDAAPITFEAELLDNDTRDVSITIELAESVLVAPRDGGGYSVSHPPEPDRIGFERFDGVPAGTTIQHFLVAGEDPAP